jgi:hypothetical protein
MERSIPKTEALFRRKTRERTIVENGRTETKIETKTVLQPGRSLVALVAFAITGYAILHNQEEISNWISTISDWGFR